MITIDNYFNEISRIDLSTLPEPLQEGHAFVLEVTGSGQNWEDYHAEESVKEVIDSYLEKLNAFLSIHKTSPKPPTKGEKKKENKGGEKRNPKRATPAKGQEPPREADPFNKEEPTTWVERIPEELRFIRRFVNMNGKSKTKEEILRFINSLQKAIIEKRIRKSSNYAEQIRFIQDKLIGVYNTMKATIRIELTSQTQAELKHITGEQKVRPAINFMKRYIAISGKPGMKQKATSLLEQIERATQKGKVTKDDPYYQEMHQIVNNLRRFRGDKSSKVLVVENKELNGLQAILNGCSCDALNGPGENPVLMNSMDFARRRFVTIGLKGKWYDLIGDPSPNFTAMVFGKPKMGKSYLCIDFAGYLARHHGRVLYVAKEEGLDMTLQKKLADQRVAHPNLFVSAELPDTLDSYDFIFLDSVNRLGLLPADLNRLKAAHPNKSFIFVFQTTKDGNFRGANSFQHDVDVVIEIPEKGKVLQFGRFNQGGEMRIFPYNQAA
ncbi:hypothetical protein [Puia dinghuensis]|uniref:AAA+ ATPase domain-containing protein n=1 Tax=Puia dinghuensis TaxID=1792502 RepID=A0A8J2UAU2_9BACT|nr:hypothetical protein [Puia dinghuensis]GGA89894.1 hypothetical protein GCM10011511_11400 [Puia dinghuensis]